MNDNKDDKNDGFDQQGALSPNGDPGHSDGPPPNDNDTRRMNGIEDGMRLRAKPAENAPSLPEKSKPTGGIQGSPLDQPPQRGRKGLRRMLSGTDSTPNVCSFSMLMEGRTGMNMTVTL
jgi:hypothetical protein